MKKMKKMTFNMHIVGLLDLAQLIVILTCNYAVFHMPLLQKGAYTDCMHSL